MDLFPSFDLDFSLLVSALSVLFFLFYFLLLSLSSLSLFLSPFESQSGRGAVPLSPCGVTAELPGWGQPLAVLLGCQS